MGSDAKLTELNLREIVERVWRARYRVLQFWILSGLATLFVILFWPRTYSSTAKLFLKKGRESIGLDPTASATGKTIALQQAGRDEEIKSAIDVLSSRGMIETIVDKLTPEVVLGHVAIEGSEEREPNPIRDAISRSMGWCVEKLRSIDPASVRERAVVKIERNLIVDAERKSEVISVVYEADNSRLAQLVVDAVATEYQTKHAELHRTRGSTEFFLEQSARLKQEIDETSDLLRSAKNRMGIASIEGQQKMLEDQLSQIRTDILETDKSLFAAEARADNLQGQLTARPQRLSTAQVTKPNDAADMQRQLLYALQLQEMDASAKFTANHPTVRSLKEQVKKAARELQQQEVQRTESTDDVNPVHEKLTMDFAENEAAIAGLMAQQSKLQGQEEQLLASIRDLNAFAIEVGQLKRDVNVAEAKYVTYAESLEEARVDLEMQVGAISSVNIAQKATYQEKPVSPSKPLTLAAGILASLAGALAIALASVQFDDALTSPQGVRRQLGVPVLGVIPKGRAYATVKV